MAFPAVSVTVTVGKATARAPLDTAAVALLAYHNTAGALAAEKATAGEVASAVLTQLLQRAGISAEHFKSPGTEAGDFLRAVAGKLDGKADAISTADATAEGMTAIRTRVTDHLAALTVGGA